MTHVFRAGLLLALFGSLAGACSKKENSAETFQDNTGALPQEGRVEALAKRL